MIKGINRQIIEITDTGNIYYERAILVVRPEYRSAQRSLLEKQARQMLVTVKSPSAIQKKTMFWYWAIRLGSSAVIGSAITAIMLHIL